MLAVAGLETGGLIIRTLDPHDRRARIPQVTTAGRRTQARVTRARDYTEAELLRTRRRQCRRVNDAGMATGTPSDWVQAGMLSLRWPAGKRSMSSEAKLSGPLPRPRSTANRHPTAEVSRRVGRWSTPMIATWDSSGAARRSRPSRRSMILVSKPVQSSASATSRVSGNRGSPLE